MRCAATLLLTSVAAGALTAACGTRPQTKSGATWTVQVDSMTDGALKVVNIPPSDPAPRWTLREELRIGSADAVGPANFGQIKGLTVLSDGRIVVLDAMAKQIRVFGPDGGHLATLGREGHGPGELDDPYGLMRDARDRLWVPDIGNARMSVYDASDGFQRAWPLRLHSYAWIWRGAMTTDGRIFKQSSTPGPPRRSLLRVLDSTMTQVDSLPLPDPPPSDPKDPPGAFAWEAPGGRGMGFIQVPFYPQARLLLDPTGSAWSRSAGDPSYRIAHWIPGGDTALVVEAARATVPVTATERDSALAWARKSIQRFGVSPHLDASKIPSVKPAVESMFLSDEGELWVGASTTDTRTIYDRFDRAGKHIETVSSPLHVAQGLSPVVRGDRFWAVVSDSLGVSYVVRARITAVGTADRDE